MEELLKALKEEELTAQEKAAKCEVWLRENPDHEMAQMVEILKGDQNTIASQQNTIASHQNTIASQQNTITSQQNTITSRSLASVKESFPVLTDTTISLPYFPKNHRHAEIHPVSVSKAIPLIAEPLMKDNFWDTAYVEDGGYVDHEAKVQQLVVSLLTAVVKSMHLSKLIDICQNRTLAGVECDVLLVYKPNRLPFAVIEVKKPGNSKEGVDVVFKGTPIISEVTKEGEEVETGGNCVAGEVFAEMVAIQMFGYSTVTGMISTGNQWRIVGLLDDKLDKSSGADMIDACVIEKLQQFLSQHQTTDGKIVGSGQSTTVSPEQRHVVFKGGTEEEARRTIWAGEIVPSHEGLEIPQLHEKVKKSGKDIVTQLVLFVAKTCSYLYDFLKCNEDPHGSITIRPKMPCRILQNRRKDNETHKHGVFAFGSLTLTRLVLENFSPVVEKIYVIRHLGMGEYGNVCLGTSKMGTNCCAIKFYHDQFLREQFATEECENWEYVYKNVSDFPKPYVLKVAGGHCLVMPYLHPIQRTQRHELLNNGVIETTLKSFAESGFLHRDIKWRHFRCWNKDKNKRGNNRVFLIDLGAGSLEECNDEVAVDTWIKKSIEILHEKAGNKSLTEEMLTTPRSETRSKMRSETLPKKRKQEA